MNVLGRVNEHLVKGELDAAKAIVAKLDSSSAMRNSLAGVIFLHEQMDEAAINMFERALALDPNEQIACAYYGRLLLRQMQSKRAVEILERCQAKNRSNVAVALSLAAALADTDKVDQALEILRPLALSDHPNNGVLLSYASLLRSVLRPSEALEILTKHEAQLAGEKAYQKAVADCLAEQEPELASERFREIGEDANEPTLWNRSFVELRLKNFELGWRLYRSGLSEAVGKVGRPLPAQVKGIPMLKSLREAPTDQWLVLSTEQGIGDQILFLSTLHELMSNYPRICILCESRMVPILKRSFPSASIYPYAFGHTIERQLQRVSGLIPIGSLMEEYRSNAADFSRGTIPYIKSNEEWVRKYRHQLKELTGNKRLIGISWNGGFWDRQQKTKSLPFERFSELVKLIPKARFVSLQYGDVTEAKAYAKKNALPVTFISGVDFKRDLDKWLALIDSCDEILSVSTAMVHFAGALGKRVRLILGEMQSPFIWGLEEGKSIAYPTVQIFRKKKEEDYTDFFSRIVGDESCESL